MNYVRARHKYLGIYALYSVLAAAILGPALQPGYVFLLDMPWPGQFRFDMLTASDGALQPHLPLMTVITALNVIVPSWILQKLVLIIILTGAGASVYYLSNYIQKSARSGPPVAVQKATSIVAGIMAMLNPFVAERLLSGQWLILAGYALTPFVLLLLLQFLKQPHSTTRLWRFSAAYAVQPMISIHWWYMATPLFIVTILLSWWRGRTQHSQRTRVPVKSLLLGVVAFIVVNWFWIGSVVSGSSQLSSVSSTDFAVFQTSTDAQYGLETNVVNLYGHWSDYLRTPKQYNRFWVVYGSATAAMAVAGALILNRRRSLAARALLVVMPVALVVAFGYGSVLGGPLIDLLQHVPGFASLRETSKLIGLLAIFVALFAPYAVASLYNDWNARKALTIYTVVIFISMSGLLLGARGQITSRWYPASYAEARDVVTATQQRTLALPWKNYLELDFADNAFVATPAGTFFGPSVDVSDITTNGLLDGPRDAFDTAVLSPYSATWVDTIRGAGYTRVLLLKTDAWRNYLPLIENHTLLYDSDEIAVIEL